MAIVIGDLTTEQIDTLRRIETECFKEEAFTREQMVRMIHDYNTLGFVAKIGDEIVGFIMGYVHAERRALQGHILTIDVIPSKRHIGIGELLLKEIEKIFVLRGVKSSHLEVREDNVAAISLYRKLGYKVIGELENYYGKVHGLYLRKDLRWL